MRVVLDANVIIERDWYLAGGVAEVLLEASRRGRIRLVIPEVVVREVVAAQGERKAAALAKLRSTAASLRRLTEPLEYDETTAVVEPFMQRTYDSALRERLAAHRVEIPPIPEVTEALVDRALQRRRPFDGKGRAGFRDALIWHTVLDGATDSRATLFATDNTRDFADEDKTKLHPHLVDDVRERGLAAEAVRLVRSLEEIARTALEPADDILGRVRQRLLDDDAWRDTLVEALRQEVESEALDIDDRAVSDIDLDDNVAPFADFISEWVLADVAVSDDVEVSDAFPLTDDLYILQLELPGIAHYQVELSTAGFWQANRIPQGLEFSGDERSAYGQGSASVRVHFDVRYDAASDTITDFAVQGLSS